MFRRHMIQELEDLLQAIEHGDEPARSRSLAVLGDSIEYGTWQPDDFRASIDRLIGAILREQDTGFRASMFRTLTLVYSSRHGMPFDFSLEPLIHALATADISFIASVLYLISFTGDEQYVPMLSRYLDHPHSGLRHQATDTLLDVLRSSSDGRHTRIVLRCLDRLMARVEGEPYQTRLDSSGRASDESALLSAWFLRSHPVDAVRRRAALTMLCYAPRTWDARTLPRIEELLDDPDPDLRQEAHRALLRAWAMLAIWREDAYVGKMEAYLEHENASLRAEANLALCHFLQNVALVGGNQKYLPVLERYATHADPELKRCANNGIDALKKAGLLR